ncbi:MAG: alpha/beta hydrolase [Deltaproteobacteria bacterium]|nr:alpha/beta hydrolase [Candidatus Zymogenaceae bacterium]
MRTTQQKILNNSGYANYREDLIDSAGTRIALSIYESKKSDPCVVFLPGTMTHPLLYDEFLSRIAARGFNVVGVHSVSHGKSPREKELYTVSGLLLNARDAVTFCLERYGGTVGVLGSSQGGLLAGLLAATDHRLRAAFAQNIILPSLPETISVTVFPRFVASVYGPVRLFMRAAFSLFPRVEMPLSGYLDIERITADKEIQQWVITDPIGLTAYPFYFMKSLFFADTSPITDGSITCPVVVIASEGDRLFSKEYQSLAFEKIVAPKKEILWFDEDCHLIMVEDESVRRVTGPIADKLAHYLK